METTFKPSADIPKLTRDQISAVVSLGAVDGELIWEVVQKMLQVSDFPPEAATEEKVKQWICE